jgi:glycolate oxidase FAD binding subunit
VPQACEPLALPFAPLVEWGGGLRWVSGDVEPLHVRSTTERAGGHATLFRGGDRSIGVFHPLKAPIAKIHKRLKDAFDPAGILNPNRMYRF